jgi:hypothetical protein
MTVNEKTHSCYTVHYLLAIKKKICGFFFFFFRGLG